MSYGKSLNGKNFLEICVVYTNLLFSHIDYADYFKMFN